MRHTPAHLDRRRVLPILPQQLCRPAQDGENISVMARQLHPRAFRHSLFRTAYRNGDHFKSVRLPEMDVQNASIHFNIPLLKSFAPTIRILARDIPEQCVPLVFGQVLPVRDGRTAAQLSVLHRNRRDDADKVLPNFLRPVIVRKKIHCLFCNSLFDLFPVGHHAPAVQILYLILPAPSVRNEFRREGRYYPKYIFFYFYNSLSK